MVYMKDLLSAITRQMDCKKDDTFLHEALKFVEGAIAILEQMEQMKKNLNAASLAAILTTATLIAENISSNTAFDAVFWVSREVGELFGGSIPENMASDYNEIQSLLTVASGKVKEIQASCFSLMEEVRTN